MRDLIEHRFGHALFVEQVIMVFGDQVALLQHRGLQTAQAIHRLDFGGKDHLVVGLRQKVVTTGLQTTGQRFAFGQRGEEDDRHQRFARQRLDLPRRLEAVHHRHHRVHQHQIAVVADETDRPLRHRWPPSALHDPDDGRWSTATVRSAALSSAIRIVSGSCACMAVN